ncbi:signal peptidase I [Aquiluna sp.]|nr:signal peptidase I [Aquiluna sp.]
MTPGGFRPRKSGLISGFRRRLRSLRKNWLLAFLIDLVAIVGFALILSVLIKAFLIRSFFIPSGSMLDTLQINDRIIVNVLAPEVVELQHGDVVVFKDPGGWLGVASALEKEPLSSWATSYWGPLESQPPIRQNTW